MNTYIDYVDYINYVDYVDYITYELSALKSWSLLARWSFSFFGPILHFLSKVTATMSPREKWVIDL